MNLNADFVIYKSLTVRLQSLVFMLFVPFLVLKAIEAQEKAMTNQLVVYAILILCFSLASFFLFLLSGRHPVIRASKEAILLMKPLVSGEVCILRSDIANISVTGLSVLRVRLKSGSYIDINRHLLGQKAEEKLIKSAI